MKKNSTYVHKPNEKYIVIQKCELEDYLAKGYIKGTGIDKSEYQKRAKKSQDTFLKKTGYKNAMQLPEVVDKRNAILRTDGVKEKRKITVKKNTLGVEYAFHNDKGKENSHNEVANKKRAESTKNTLNEKYDGKHPMELKETQDKLKVTMLELYGVEYYAQTGLQQYYYDNEEFDTIPEIALWVYSKDNNFNIKRNYKLNFEYTFNNKVHHYFPDFIINGELIEIKGDHFFKEDGTMCNPYDHSQDALYEAKH